MAGLHGYILRELLKTFGLALIALSALFTMGGGLYNTLKYEGVGAGDLLGSIPLLIPIVVTLTMPVAALFAVTMVYGRLAADNELLACRAAGINIHRLFLSALLLSVFVMGFTLLLGDLVIPNYVRRLELYARANLRDIALQKMQVMGHVRYEREGHRYLLTARRVQVPTRQALREKDLPTQAGISYLLVDAPVFLHIDASDALVRQASARYGLCQFDARASPLEVTIYVDQGRDFDLRGRSVRLQEQQIGPISIPLEFPRKSSMVDMATLLQWRQRPWEVDRLRPAVQDFWLALQNELFMREAAQRVADGQPLVLAEELGRTFRITGSGPRADPKGLLLADARVEIVDDTAPRPLFYDVPELLLSTSTANAERVLIELHLREAEGRLVREHNPRVSDYEPGTPKASFVLSDAVPVPESILDSMRAYAEPEVFDPRVALPLGERLARQRAQLVADGQAQRRKMTSVIHFRLGFSSSVLVTVLMAAALGVIFRGSRALAAFGLACIPFGSVALLLVMARQLAEHRGTALLGPLLTWGGLAFVALLDGLILRLGVRR